MQQAWYKKRIHVSWFVAWTSAGIIVGAMLAPSVGSSNFVSYDWLVIAGSLMVVATLGRTMPMVLLAIVAGLVLGLWRGSIEYGALAGYQPFYESTVNLSGRVTEDTSYGARGDQRIRLSKIAIDDQLLPGDIWASTDSTLDIKRGDNVELKGRLGHGFGNLPATMYKAEVTNVERPHPGDVARRVRDWFAGGVRQSIPEPQASLSLGYLVGQRSTLPEHFSEQLRIAGLTHAIVASGYNLTILASISRRLLSRVSKYLSMLSASVMIGSFMLITGLSPSMSRAGLVSGLSLAAWYYGRSLHPGVLLPFSAAVTVLIRPAYVWGDMGWYLSFTAFMGVILLAPLLHHFFWGLEKKPGIIREIVVATTAAQLTTLPIILFAFGQYSSYALPANILILPLVPLTMILTFISGIAGLIAPALAVWFGIPASAILSYMVWVVGWIAGLPGASGEIIFGFPMLVAGYALLALVTALLWHKTQHDFRSGQNFI